MADYNLLIFELENFTFTLLNESFLLILYQSKISFASLRMKNIVFPACSRFPVKLIYCTAFGSASSVCCLLKSIPITS